MAATEISVDHIARVEGHGDIRLVIEDGQVTTCEMAVVEPARLFESMVRGRSFEEVPYIASRVCGICSSSHVVTDLRAIEQVFGVEVTDRTEALRELLLYGSYRAVNKPLMSVILTVASLGTRVALAYALAPLPAVGVIGIWAAIGIGYYAYLRAAPR